MIYTSLILCLHALYLGFPPNVLINISSFFFIRVKFPLLKLLTVVLTLQDYSNQQLQWRNRSARGTYNQYLGDAEVVSSSLTWSRCFLIGIVCVF